MTSGNTLVYLHSDHLGSMSAVTNETGQKVAEQEFDPWGKVRPGGSVTQTKHNFTGQKLDDTGLLFYNARYYDPGLGRFVSPDSVVPGTSLGVGGALGTVGAWQNSTLTVDFHDSGFLSSVQGENAITAEKGFWFQLDHASRTQAARFGPINPQALGRYTYVLNNPLRYLDPTGHSPKQCTSYPCDAHERAANAEAAGKEYCSKSIECQAERLADSGASLTDSDGGLPGGIPGAGLLRVRPKGHGYIPTKAFQVADHAKAKNGAAQPGYKGGSTYHNDGRSGSPILPKYDSKGKPITYTEYDVNPYQKGVDRGKERVVIGTDGRRYYTYDHYTTFTEF